MKISAVEPKLASPNGKFIKFLHSNKSKKNSQVTVIGVTISCELDSLGFGSRRGKKFFSSPKISKTFEVSIQPRIQLVLAFFHGGKAAGARS